MDWRIGSKGVLLCVNTIIISIVEDLRGWLIFQDLFWGRSSKVHDSWLIIAELAEGFLLLFRRRRQRGFFLANSFVICVLKRPFCLEFCAMCLWIPFSQPMDRRSCLKADIKVKRRVSVFIVNVNVVVAGWFSLFVLANVRLSRAVEGWPSRFYEYLKIVYRLFDSRYAGEWVQTLVCDMLVEVLGLGSHNKIILGHIMILLDAGRKYGRQ